MRTYRSRAKSSTGVVRRGLSGTLTTALLSSLLLITGSQAAGANAFTVQLTRISDGVAPFEDWRTADTTAPTGDPAVTQAADDSNGDGVDADPGDDVNAHDSYGANGVGIVRTLDRVKWQVAYTLSKNIGDDNNALGVSVYVDVPAGFAIVAGSLPPSGAASPCPSGTSQVTITAAMNPDPLMVGGTRLSCLFPSPFDISSSVSRFFTFEVDVAGSLPNGVAAAGAAEYAPTVVMKDSEGSPTVTRTRVNHPAEAVVVSAAPRYDLRKDANGNFAASDSAVVESGGALYYNTQWQLWIRPGDPDRRGLSTLGNITLQDVYENLTPGMTAIPYTLQGCTISSGFTATTGCAQPGGTGTPISIGMAFTNWQQYLNSLNGAAPGRIVNIDIRIPMSYVDTQDGNPTNGVGSIRVRNHISDGFTGTTAFDPNDVSGVSNFLSGQEARPVPTTPAQVDGYQNTYDKTYTLVAPGITSNKTVGPNGTPISGESVTPPDLMLIDNQPFITSLQMTGANNYVPGPNIICDKWDNARTGLRGTSEAQFIRRADPVTISGALPYVIEYGKSAAFGAGVADSGAPATWYAQNNATCADSDGVDLGGGVHWATGSQVDWANAGTGLVNSRDLNMVRIRFPNALTPGVLYSFWLFWQAKDIDAKLWHLNSSAAYSPVYTTPSKWIVPAGTGCSAVTQTCPVPPSGVPMNADGYVNLGATSSQPVTEAPGIPGAFAWQHADPELQVDSCSLVAGSSVCTATTSSTPGSAHVFRMRLSACIGRLDVTLSEANIAPMTATNHKGGSCYTPDGNRYDLLMAPTIGYPYNAAIPNVQLVDDLPPGFIPQSATTPWKTVNGSATWVPADGCPPAGCEVIWDLGTIPAGGFSPTVDLTTTIDIATPYATYANRARGRYLLFDQPSAWTPQNVTVAPSGSALITKAASAGKVLEGTDVSFSISERNDSVNVWDSADTVDLLPYNGDGRGTSLSGALVLKGVTATAALKSKMDLFVSGTAPATLDALDAPTGPPYVGVPPGVTYPAPIFSASDKLLDPRFNRTANALGSANWPCKVDWSSGTFALIPVAPATSCPALNAITAVRMVGYDSGKPVDAQNLPIKDGNAATGFLLAGEAASVTITFGTQNLEPGDKMVNTVRGSFGNSYDGGTSESDAPPLPADFNAGSTIYIYDGVIGNLLFADSNANGRMDVGDAGISGVTLELLDSLGNPAVDGDGAVVPNVTTDASGRYAFLGLKPGTYMVRVLAAELLVGGDLFDYRVSPVNGLPDSDADETLDQNLLLGFVTAPITLTMGGEPTGEVDPTSLVPTKAFDVDGNLTLDLGVVPPASLALTKTPSVNSIHSGDSVTYTFKVEARGTAVHNVTVTDTDSGCTPAYVSGDTNTDSILGLTEMWTYTCTVSSVTDALDGTSNTDHTNTGTAKGLDVLNVALTTTTDATVDIIASTIAVVKSADTSSVREGNDVQYTFEVTNTGDPLKSVTVSDTDADCNSAMTGPTGDDGDGRLEVGETWSYTCTIAVTDALDGTTNTDHTNTVTAEGSDPLGLATSAEDTLTVDIVDATISVTKSPDVLFVSENGTVNYTFEVTSTGDDLHSVSLSDTDSECNDSLSGPTGDDGDGVLQAGETWEYTCAVTVTDALDGTTKTDHSNTVTVNGTDASGATVDDIDAVTVDIVASTIAITKTPSATSIHEDDSVTYTFDVTSTGDPVKNVVVSDTDTACNDSLSGPTGDDGDGVLEAGETWTYTCDVTVTDALDGTTNTDHTNTVSVDGTDLAGVDLSASADATVDIVASQIAVTKAADHALIHEGDTVTYTFVVTNTGDPLHAVTLDDTDSECNTTMTAPTGDDGDGVLQASESWTYTCTVEVTDGLDGTSDSDHSNTVTADGKDPADVSTTADAVETVDIVSSSISVTKTPDPIRIYEGGTVTYTFEVTGHGDPQHSVVISDTDSECDTTMAGPTGDDGDGFLNDGEVWSYTCTVDVTDALDGTNLTDHSNTVTVHAKDPVDADASATAEAQVDIITPDLNISKIADPVSIHEGDTVTYSFEVWTEGDAVSDVTVSDTDSECNTTMTAPTGDDGDGILQSGEIWEYTCTVVVTDALDGTTKTDHTNTATVMGNDLLSGPLSSTDGAEVDIVGSTIALTKTPSVAAIHSGDTVTYTFVATSTGDPLANVSVTDSDSQCNASMTTPSGDVNDNGLLDAGEEWTFTCSLHVTDATDGTSNTDHSNTASVAGIDPLGKQESADADATVDIVGSDLSLQKVASPTAILPGESVTYTFTLSSSGDPVANPTITDPQCVVGPITGDTNTNGILEVSETWTATCVVATVTDATDGLTNAKHVNTATAGGNDPLGLALTATASAEVHFLGAIGDRVWIDQDHNGRQDAGELPAVGLQVELFECTTADTASCTLRAATTTDASGNYLFNRLAEGHYQVRFLATDGLSFTDMTTGATPSTDSDAASDGKTLVIALAAGERNMTIDAGLVSAFNLLISKTVAGNTVSQALAPGTQVTFEINITNDGAGASYGDVMMSDVLPSGMTYVSHTAPSGWACSVENNTLTCARSGMPAGAKASFTVTVALDASLTGGELKNVARTSSSGTEGVSTDNNSEAAVTVLGTEATSPSPPPAEPRPIPPTPGAPAPATPTVVPAGQLAKTGRDTLLEIIFGAAFLAAGTASHRAGRRLRRRGSIF